MKQRSYSNVRLLAAMAAVLGLSTLSASAMHIAEGYLPKTWAFGWMAVCVPFVVAGFCPSGRRWSAAPGPRSCWPCAAPSPSSSRP